MGRGWNRYSFSRPEGVQRTKPARASTSRCFVMAWRVRRECCVSSEMEHGCPADSRARSARRVASPRAAKSKCGGGTGRRLLLVRDIVFDVLDLLRPAAVVHAEGFC